MASVTKTTNEKSMADDESRPESKSGEPKDTDSKAEAAAKPDKSRPVDYAGKQVSNAGPGYFSVYKSGQGYWTRFGTVAGAVVIGAFTAYNLYEYIPTFLSMDHDPAKKVAAIIAVAFAVAFAALGWWLLNKHDNVDFLIATDSEMKKVNWTSRKELVGSTQIVVIFMFLVAFFLFAVDWIFGTLMWLIKVLSVPPWGA